ncbi:MAG: serine/threonine-protein kinase [Polyangia bacterium]
MSASTQQTAPEAGQGGAAALVGATLAGRYRVESLLGEGGMGAVYLVTHLGIRKRMALKLLRPELIAMPSALARFEREAMAAAHFEHPNVAAATDYGRIGDGAGAGRFYLALEYVEGTELRRVIEASKGPLPPARALFLLRQVVSALCRASELGIVHRDLKPENIMLVRRDGHDDFVKILDFGLAQLSRRISEEPAPDPAAPTEQKLTQVGEIFGTPAYMAPEQAFGGAVDLRSDLYAVGVMLYELLTGVRPFVAKSPIVLIQQVLSVEPPPMGERAPGVQVPKDMEALARRLLAKRPEDRIQTPQELLEAIDALVAAHGLVWPVAGAAPRSPVRPSQPTQPALSMPTLLGRAATVLGSRLGLSAPDSTTSSTTSTLPGGSAGGAGGAEQAAPRARGVLALGGLVLGGVLVVALVMGGRGKAPHALEVPEPGRPALAPRPTAPSDLAPQAALDQASQKGVDALRALVAEFPLDPRAHRALVRSLAEKQRLVEAMQAMAPLGRLDPGTARDTEMVKILVAAIQGPPEALQAAAVLLEEDLGEAGVDLLYDLTVKQTQAKWKPRINQSLTRPEVVARASAATRVALELRAARTCEAKRELLGRAQREGDHRALALLRPLQWTRGCGFFSLQDCWPCMRRDGALQQTISAIEARAKAP